MVCFSGLRGVDTWISRLLLMGSPITILEAAMFLNNGSAMMAKYLAYEANMA